MDAVEAVAILVAHIPEEMEVLASLLYITKEI
jgi:hypothetical protein